MKPKKKMMKADKPMATTGAMSTDAMSSSAMKPDAMAAGH
jgi:hypothetical protein